MGGYTVGPCECCGPSVCGGSFWLFDALGYTFSQVQVTIQFQEGDFSGLGERTDGRTPVPSWVPSPTPMNGTYVFDLGLHYQTREPVSSGLLFRYYSGSVPPNPSEREGALPNYTDYTYPNDPNQPGDPTSGGPSWAVTQRCSSSLFGVSAHAFTHEVAKRYTISDTPDYEPHPNSYAARYYGRKGTFGTYPGAPPTIERDFTGLYIRQTPIRQLDDGRWLVLRESKTNPNQGYNAYGTNPFTVSVDISLS